MPPDTAQPAGQDRVTDSAALTTNAPCAVLLTPPITAGGALRLTSLTAKISDDEMWGRLALGHTWTDGVWRGWP